MKSTTDITELAYRLKEKGAAYAVATVVRTVAVTAAKPGAKALIDIDGNIIEGWIGGGCARHAVVSAARKSIRDGQPRFVTIQPEELLKERGLSPGQDNEGVYVARNMCPSKGSMEIFIEPVLSNPELLVFGASPVASTLTQLAGNFGFHVAIATTGRTSLDVPGVHDYGASENVPVKHAHRYIVIATQGSGDVDSLNSALALQSRHIAFVGSHKKLGHLRQKLVLAGQSEKDLERVKGPAGLDLGAVTPQEIALSILAEIVQIRRKTIDQKAEKQSI